MKTSQFMRPPKRVTEAIANKRSKSFRQPPVIVKEEGIPFNLLQPATLGILKELMSIRMALVSTPRIWAMKHNSEHRSLQNKLALEKDTGSSSTAIEAQRILHHADEGTVQGTH